MPARGGSQNGSSQFGYQRISSGDPVATLASNVAAFWAFS